MFLSGDSIVIAPCVTQLVIGGHHKDTRGGQRDREHASRRPFEGGGISRLFSLANC